MALEGLGRLFNVAPSVGGASASGSAALSMRDADAITFVCTGADTYTITTSDSFSGTYADPGDIIDHFYKNTKADGTVAWTLETQAASNAVTQSTANAVTVITVLGPSLPDGDKYVKCTVTGTTGKVVAIVHDLDVMRKPANLAVLSA